MRPNEACETCESCGGVYPKDRLIDFDGQLRCPDCLTRATVICARIWRDEDAGDDTTPLCQHCYDHWYFSCSSCGRIIHVDDAHCHPGDDDESYCHDGFNQVIHWIIQDYHYKPEPLFRGSGPRCFGVELKIDGAGEEPDNASELQTIANGNGLKNLYIKRGGSLEDDMELVPHPMSLDYHFREMPWAAILRKAALLGYTNHQAWTCWLHDHVSRAALGEDGTAQDAVIARILWFFGKNREELLKFSRRTPWKLERWAAHCGYKEQPRDILDHAKKSGGAGRYTCVNPTNVDSIEFRMTCGTLAHQFVVRNTASKAKHGKTLSTEELAHVGHVSVKTSMKQGQIKASLQLQ